MINHVDDVITWIISLNSRTFFGFGGSMGHKMTMPAAHELISGRDQKMAVNPKHTVNGNPTQPPFPVHTSS